MDGRMKQARVRRRVMSWGWCWMLLACGTSPDLGAGDAGGDAGDVGGGAVTWNVCQQPSQCVLQPKGCCASCIDSVETLDGVHKDQQQTHRDAVCPNPGQSICPACATMLNPNLLATCGAEQRCAVVDVRQQSLSNCVADSDCVLRVPDCCPCGADLAAWRLIAIHKDRQTDYAALVCDANAVCAQCAPLYPTTVQAVCGSDNHCVVNTCVAPACVID